MRTPYRFFIKDLECLPGNPEAFKISVNFFASGDKDEGLQLTTSRLRFNMEARDVVMNHIAEFGAFENIPVTLEIDGVKFDFFIDLQDNLIKGQTFIECSIKKRNSVDTFMNSANGTTYELLNLLGKIQDGDKINVPYIIIRDDQALTLLFLAITAYNVGKALIEQIRDTADAISDLAALLAPDFNAGGIVVKLGAIIKQALKVLFMLAYTIALILIFKSLIEQIIELIIPKLRYFKAMKFKRLLEIGCAHLGYTLKSSLLDQMFGMTFLPAPRESRIKSLWEFAQDSLPEVISKGYPTDQDSINTVGSLVTFLESFLNVKRRIIGNVLYLENEIYFESTASTTIANNFNIQDSNEDQTTPDLSNVYLRNGLVYARDVMDTNTFDYIKGSSYESQTVPINVENEDLTKGVKGVNIIRVPFSLGKRKEELTFVEKTLLKLAKSVDKFTGSNSASKVKNRLGALVISGQFFGNSKILWLVGDKQPSNYLNFIGAKAVFSKFHAPYLNKTYDIKAQMPTQFTGQMFLDILNNNYVPLETGGTAEFITVDYTPYMRSADIDYRTPADYAKNTKQIQVYED